VKIWDTRTGECVKELAAGDGCQLQFSSDGRWLLTTGGQKFRLWETETWREAKSWGPTPPGGRGAFSPDGRLLALSDFQGAIRLLSLPGGEEIGGLPTSENEPMHPVLFTPDLAWLVAQDYAAESLFVFDLRRVRAGLAELGLDWDSAVWPPLSPPSPVRPIMKVVVDLGELGPKRDGK
jgi:WD40 repeat protein